MQSGYEALPPRKSRKRTRSPGAEAAAAAANDAARAEFHGGTDAEGDACVSASASAPPPVIFDFAAEGAQERWEYLDHTADVQVHSWGNSLGEAFAQCALGMWAYMSDPDTVEVDPECDCVVEASGHDLINLLFHFLDECLTQFTTTDFLCKTMRITSFTLGHASSSSSSSSSNSSEGAGSSAPYTVRAECRGERFVFGRHTQGTEVKAITYSNMQIRSPDGVVTAASGQAGDAADGTAVADESAADGGAGGAADAEAPSAPAAATESSSFPYQVYVIVDI